MDCAQQFVKENALKRWLCVLHVRHARASNESCGEAPDRASFKRAMASRPKIIELVRPASVTPQQPAAPWLITAR
jgi:hypothetical protein